MHRCAALMFACLLIALTNAEPNRDETPSRLGIRRGEAAKYISESARMLRSLRRHTKIPLPLPVDDDSFIFRATRRPLQSHPH